MICNTFKFLTLKNRPNRWRNLYFLYMYVFLPQLFVHNLLIRTSSFESLLLQVYEILDPHGCKYKGTVSWDMKPYI